MQKTLVFVLAALISTTFAAKEDCTYDLYASEADDQVHNYQYCDVTTNLKMPVTAAKNTAHLQGKMYSCNILEPDLSDEQLEAQLGLKSRPNFLGKFYQDSSNVWWMDFGQYGQGCGYAQRTTQVKYGVEFCAKVSEGMGYAHEMYFLSNNCSGLASYSQVPMIDLIANKFDTIQNDLFDPYPFLAAVTGLSYVVKNKVLSKAYTVAPGAVAKDSYCHGIGQKFMPPVHLPTIATSGSVKSYYNQIYLPYNGQMCGFSCTADVQAALVAAAGNAALIPAKFANTTCGQGYGLMRNYNASFATGPYGGLTSGAYFFSSLILHYSSPRTCGVCENATAVMNADPLALITVVANQVNSAIPVVSVKSRMVYCQTDMIAKSFVFQPQPDTPQNPENCGAEYPTVYPTVYPTEYPTEYPTDVTSSVPSMNVLSTILFAFVVSLLVSTN